MASTLARKGCIGDLQYRQRPRLIVGSIQQAGEGATQTATVYLNVGAVQAALDEFVAALDASGVPVEIRNTAMIEVETIRPQ